MKNLLSTLLLALAVSFMFSACEGPAGADGQDGAEGPAGVAGADGQDGVNAAETCTECHNNSQLIVTKENQYMVSGHATGTSFERNAADCAPCHTSQGFLEVLETGAMVAAADVMNPAPANCYTCHDIHSTYTDADWGLTLNTATEMWIGETVEVNGSGKMCVQCHQPRLVDDFPVHGGADVDVNSSRWGPHHGPQGAMYAGVGMYDFGATIVSTHQHQSAENSCNTCHMQTAYGTQAGGHTLHMNYEYHGAAAPWVEDCLSCHVEGADALHTKIEEFEVEVEALVAELVTELTTAGVLSATGSIVQGLTAPDLAGALYNYKFIEEDLSTGIHNPTYTKNILNASIAAVAAVNAGK